MINDGDTLAAMMNEASDEPLQVVLVDRVYTDFWGMRFHCDLCGGSIDRQAVDGIVSTRDADCCGQPCRTMTPFTKAT